MNTPPVGATLVDEQAFFDHAREIRESKRAARSAAPSAAGDNKAASHLKANAAADETLGDPSDAAAYLRIDTTDETFYVGRAGVRDNAGDALVYSWKARFIQGLASATAQDPGDVVRQRRYYVKPVNTITETNDTVFAELAQRIADLEGVNPGKDPVAYVMGEDSLLVAVLEQERKPEMRQIVETIQAAQAALISADADQLLVVQGGPGTGKTAVALHRVSSLLYEGDVAPEDVLIIGPNPTFTRYISKVLPELGDEHVRQTDITRLLGTPVTVNFKEEAAAARLKGDDRMVEVLAKGLRDRLRHPADSQPFTVRGVSWRVRLEPVEVATMINEESDMPYSSGRVAFRERLTSEIAVKARRRAKDDRSRISGDVRDLLDVSEIDNAIERIWPQLSPQSYVRDLYGSLERLVSAAQGTSLTVDELQLLRRASAPRLAEQTWSREDIVLLDHAAAEMGGESESYKHIVVDEAQDLSPMQWLAVRRRSANGAFTVVGDIAQSTGLWARDGWDEVVNLLRSPLPHESVELKYGYRVPRQVMDLAARLLPTAAPGITAPLVVRDAPRDPQFREVAPESVALAAVRSVQEHSGKGRFLGVVCPDARRDEIIAALRDEDINWDDADNGALGASINLVSPVAAKGLEFDAVVVVDPAEIVKAGPHGERMLYIALTRTTKYLDVIYPVGSLPSTLSVGEPGNVGDAEATTMTTGPADDAFPATPFATIDIAPTTGQDSPAIASPRVPSAAPTMANLSPSQQKTVRFHAANVFDLLEDNAPRHMWRAVLAAALEELEQDDLSRN